MIFDRGLFDKENPGYEWQNEKWEWDMPEAMLVKFFKVEATQEDFDLIQRSNILNLSDIYNTNQTPVSEQLSNAVTALDIINSKICVFAI